MSHLLTVFFFHTFIYFLYYFSFLLLFSFFFFFNDTATTEIYTLSLHDALPILLPTDQSLQLFLVILREPIVSLLVATEPEQDRKSTRLNSSHMSISYAVFCLKKKKKKKKKKKQKKKKKKIIKTQKKQ